MPDDAQGSSRPDASPKHPIKPFYLAKTPIQALLALPGQILFAIAGLFGLAHYARQIVHVSPKVPGALYHVKGHKLDLNRWVKDNLPSLKGSFVPTRWLPNGHLQTMYSVVGDFTKIDKIEYERAYLRVPDGGTLGLDFTPPNYDRMDSDTPTIVVCHGLTGGSHESYVRNILSWVVKPKSEGGFGGRAVVINVRAGVPVTTPQFYSAGTTVDLATSLHYLRHILPSSPLHGIGFSLGASVLSRHLGETGDQSLLSSGIVLGAPWDLPKMSIKLEGHWFISRVYSTAMAQNLLKLTMRHYNANPGLFDNPDSPTAPYMDTIKKMSKKGGVRLKQVDQVMVSRFGGPQGIGLWPFSGADAYYDWASPRKLIHGVKRPLLAINAFDDPIIDGASLPIEEFANSSHVYGAISGGGGHLGWFEGSRANDRWVKKPVSEWFNAASRDFKLAGPAIETIEDGEKGWHWVTKEAHAIPGIGAKAGGGNGRIGWKVLDEGEIVKGEEAEGVLQGL